MATIRDVADRAGVSSSTVSRVLNGYSMVSDEMQALVMKAADELGYVPNSRGRPSLQSRNRTILVVSAAAPGDILAGINTFALEHGYETMVSIITPDTFRSYMRYVSSGTISGIILLNIRLEPEVLASTLEKCPVVQCNEYENVPEVSLVTFDNMYAAKDITEFVIKTGKKRPAFVTAQNAFGHAVKFLTDREYGFKQALEEAGIPITANSITKVNFAHKGESHEDFLTNLSDKIRNLLSLPKSERPDAFICMRDDLASCCLKTAQVMGISVPDELAITAFDNSSSCILAYPELTSVIQPFYDMGFESAKLLIDSINSGGSVQKRVLLNHKIIVREST